MKVYRKINKETQARYGQWYSLGVEYRKKLRKRLDKRARIWYNI